MLSPNVNLVTQDWLFNTEQEAQNAINKLTIYQGNAVKIFDKRIKAHKYIGKSNYSRNYDMYSRRLAKRFANPANYSVVEWKPEFAYRATAKSWQRSWVDGSARQFCNECGAATHAASYYIIGGSKICVFCLEELGKMATKKLDEMSVEDPMIRESPQHDIR